jgi:membrane protein
MYLPLRLREAMNLGGLSVRELCLRTWNKIQEHEILTRASAVSFYAMLALVPFLALVLTLTCSSCPTSRGGRASRSASAT